MEIKKYTFNVKKMGDEPGFDVETIFAQSWDQAERFLKAFHARTQWQPYERGTEEPLTETDEASEWIVYVDRVGSTALRGIKADNDEHAKQIALCMSQKMGMEEFEFEFLEGYDDRADAKMVHRNPETEKILEKLRQEEAEQPHAK